MLKAMKAPKAVKVAKGMEVIKAKTMKAEAMKAMATGKGVL